MYQVQEYADGKWWPIRSYEKKEDAELHAKQLPKGRIKKI